MLIMADNFCRGTASIWGVLGWFVVALKIVIPLMLIILGMLDLGKAVISSDEKAINKATTTLIKRFIAAVIVFFVPTIVSALFNAVTNINIAEGDSKICVDCLLNITAHDSDGYCKSSVVIDSDTGLVNPTDDNATT